MDPHCGLFRDASDVRLELRVLGADAVGEVRVRISDENGEHPGRGFSTNILESSIKAYVNAINKALYYIE